MNVVKKISSVEYLVIALLIVSVISPVFSNIRWKIFLDHSGINESLLSLVQISLKSYFWALLLPISFSFDAFRMYNIEKKHPEKRGISGGSVFAERMAGFCLWCTLGFVACFFLPDYENIHKVRIMMTVITVVVFFLSLVIINNRIFLILSSLFQRIPFFKQVFLYISSLHESLTMLPYKKIFRKALPVMIAMQLTDIFILYLLFMAFGVNISFVTHVALITVVQLIAMVPVSIAGLGLREGTFIYFYGLINIESDVSFAVSILGFFVITVVPGLWGGLIALYEKFALLFFTEKTEAGN